MKRYIALILMGLLTACSGASTPSSTPNPDTSDSATKYMIGGEVSGLSGSLVLQNNSADDLTLSSNGAFSFVTALAD